MQVALHEVCQGRLVLRKHGLHASLHRLSICCRLLWVARVSLLEQLALNEFQDLLAVYTQAGQHGSTDVAQLPKFLLVLVQLALQLLNSARISMSLWRPPTRQGVLRVGLDAQLGRQVRALLVAARLVVIIESAGPLLADCLPQLIPTEGGFVSYEVAPTWIVLRGLPGQR